MTRFRLLLVLGATALSLTTATAHANQEWNYHATLCSPVNSGTTSAVYNVNGINNVSSTAPLVVDCPLPTTMTTPDIGLLYVFVSLFDRGNTRASCTLNLVDFLANPLYQAVQTSPGSGSGAQILEFDLPANPGFPASNFWQLECTIPAVYRNSYSALTAINMVGTK